MTEKSIAVSERTHASLFLLQAKIQVLQKKRMSMDKIINKLLFEFDREPPLSNFKLENIET